MAPRGERKKEKGRKKERIHEKSEFVKKIEEGERKKEEGKKIERDRIQIFLAKRDGARLTG